MRQASAAATSGFISFLKGGQKEDNPYNTEVEYKDWMAGFRNGETASVDEINMFKWIYSW
jgi:ribosome modulation factor